MIDSLSDRLHATLLSPRLRQPAIIASALAMLATLFGAFVYAPADAIEGDVQRIFYIHVPMAWVAYMAFGIVAGSSAMFLWRKQSRWDILARSAAEVGLVFTTLVLLTGSLWGRPIWGTWWAWDARLTTTLILWVLYAGYLTIRSFVGEEESGARFAAVVGVLGFVDVPIVHMSVTWWRTLHPQPIVIKPLESPALPNEMLAVMTVGVVAMTLVFVTLVALRYSLGVAEERLRLRRRRAYVAALLRTEKSPGAALG